LLADLVESYLFEGLDKQLVKRIPYALFLSVLVYLVLKIGTLGSFETSFAFVIIGPSFLIFVITSYQFGKVTSGILASELYDQDFKKFLGKIQGIYEGRDSLLGDIDGVRDWKLLAVGLVSGLTLTVFLSSVILFGIFYAQLSIPFAGMALVLTTLYLYYDIAKAPIFESPEAEQKNPFAFDAFESYTVTNSMSRIPFGSKNLVFLAGKFLGPLANINVPKFGFEAPLVYETPELVSEVRHLAECGEKSEVCLKHEAGLSMDQFFLDEGVAKGERITVTLEKSPRALYPYLLDPNYVYSDKETRRWMAFCISEKASNRVLGRIFMHKFRAVSIKRRLRRGSGGGRIDPDFQDRSAIQFVLIGDRGYIQYFKSRIEVLTTKVPPDLLNAEYDPQPGRN
jgi:hypothetical protein